jgi:hypothetical protein
MKLLLLLGLLVASAAHAIPVNPACPTTSGPLTLRVGLSRSSCISPCLVFFDATSTTDTTITGNTTVFQDVTITWDFGDTLASGRSKWTYGSNAGNNSRNAASGGISAHLFITQGRDTKFTITATAKDAAGNTTKCGVGITAFEPSGANGFPTTATTCVFASTLGSGCPTGAATLNTSSFNTALGSTHFGSGKRVLFKCGDTFTGDNAAVNGTKWSIGAYGTCPGTTTNRPIMQDSGTAGQFTITSSSTNGDGRISDLAFQGNNTAAYGVQQPPGNFNIVYQITLNNLNFTGELNNWQCNSCSQWGVVSSVGNQTHGSPIGQYINVAGSNPCSAYPTACWPSGGFVATPIYTAAILGNSLTGVDNTGTGAGIEVLRCGYCDHSVISNNTIQGANGVGAVLKLHNGNSYNSVATPWNGLLTQFIVVSDNWFGGHSGSQLVETAPENANDDERLSNILVERNLFSATTGVSDGRELLVSAVNETVRDNIFYIATGATNAPFLGVQIAKRGIEPTASAVEIYNNTFYFLTTQSGQSAFAFSGTNYSGVAGINSYAKNNLFYSSTAGHSTFTDSGTGNTISNNTSTNTNDPSITNGSGTFGFTYDFQPTTNYAGGTSVPVIYDALGVAWSPTWDLGAIHH